MTQRVDNGRWTYEGRVEVFHNGVWGTVCDDMFTSNRSPKVFCKSLGIEQSEHVRFVSAEGFTYGVRGHPVPRMWLDNVSCRGTEENIVACPHNAWGSNNCGSGEIVGVRCLYAE